MLCFVIDVLSRKLFTFLTETYSLYWTNVSFFCQNPEQVYLSMLGDEAEDASGLPQPCWVPAEEAMSRSSVQ